MTDEERRDRVLDYEYGEMSPGEAAAFEEALRGDAELRKALEDLRIVRRAADGLAPQDMPRPLVDQILAMEEREARRRVRARRLEALGAFLRSPYVIGTAAAVVVMAVGWRRFIQPPTDGTGTAGQGEPRTTQEAPVGTGTQGPAPTEGERAASIRAESPADAAVLLARARRASDEGRPADALALCRDALAADPSGELLADVLALAAATARATNLPDEADRYLRRLETLPGGAERAAGVRAQPIAP